ncbi:hypothetical protein BDF19DRAFT_417202 [Syncephalis fuscata]|nr:hypothetical protein BDF19DRAFT_417202 [Syncephalis fuscata]
MSHLSKDQLSLIKSTGVVELDRQIKMTRHEPDSLQELRYILLGYYYKPQEQQQHATSFRVVVAQSVWDKFYQIIDMLGGIKEKLRAETIRYRFNEWLVCPSPGTSAIIPSLPHSCQLSIINTTTADHENTEAVLINPSAHSIVLSRRILTLNRRLTPLQKTVFGLGDALNATTITANERAIRKIEESLNDTGVIGTWLHSPRSLCGDKLEIL